MRFLYLGFLHLVCLYSDASIQISNCVILISTNFRPDLFLARRFPSIPCLEPLLRDLSVSPSGIRSPAVVASSLFVWGVIAYC